MTKGGVVSGGATWRIHFTLLLFVLYLEGGATFLSLVIIVFCCNEII